MAEEICPPLIPENCDTCFLLQFTDCATIQINAGVDPLTTYYLFVEDHFERQFRTQITTDSNGDFVINGGLFPAGFFNSYGGQYEILIATDDQGANIVPMNIGLYGAPFNCALLSFDIEPGDICCDDPIDVGFCPSLCQLIESESAADIVTCIQTATPPKEDDVKALLCSAPSGIAYDRPRITGQTSIHRTGDDGDNFTNGVYDYTPPPFPVSFARLDHADLSPFVTLLFDNIFSNKDRFTDTVGGQVYGGGNGSLSDYVIDHLTGLGWFRVAQSALGWNAAVDAGQSFSTHFSDWRLPSSEELQSLADQELSPVLSYAPFSIAVAANYWSSSTGSQDSTRAFQMNASNGGVGGGAPKTNLNAYFVCRNHFL